MNTKIVKIFTVILLSIVSNINSMAWEKGALKLLDAAARGSLEGVQNALKDGVDINFECEKGRTALLCAIESGNIEIAKLLIDAGADINVQISHRKETPIYYAIKRLNFDMVKLLVWSGVDIGKPCGISSSWGFKFHSTNIIMPIDFAYDKILVAGLDWEWASMREGGYKMHSFFIKYYSKLKDLKNKSLKNITKEVNKFLVQKIREQEYLPRVLQAMVIDYSLYPENFEEFFNLSDQEIDELIKIYADEFEKKDRLQVASSKIKESLDIEIENENSISIKSKKMRLK